MSDFKLRCRACNQYQISDPHFCENCGPVGSFFTQIDSDQHCFLVCQKCNKVSKKIDYSELNLFCINCNSSDLGWCSESANQWSHPQVDKNIKGFWIKAEFDGDYKDPITFHADLVKIEIIRGYLRNPIKLGQKPLIEINENNFKPIFISVLHNTFIEYEDKNKNKQFYQTSLNNFSLYDWYEIHENINDKSSSITIGRVIGTAYGFIMEPKELDSLEVDQKKISDLFVQPKEEFNKFNTRYSSLNDPNTTNKQIDITSGEHNPLDLKEEQSRIFGESNDHSQSPDPRESNNEKCFMFSLPLTITIFAYLWSICGFQNAIYGMTPFAIYWFFFILGRYPDGLLINKIRKSNTLFDHHSNKLSISALLLSLSVLFLYFINLNTIDAVYCNNFLPFWVYLIPFLLAISFLFRRCWLFVGLSMIWAITLILNCANCIEMKSQPVEFLTPPLINEDKKTEQESQKINNKLPISSFFEKFTQEIENLYDDLKHAKENSSAINDQGNYRVNLEKALSDPKKYLACSDDPKMVYEIYLGGKALFPFRSTELNDDSKVYLRKLDKLIKKSQVQSIILIGNSDTIGSEEAKLKISYDRADTIANWLIGQNAISPDRIQVRAASDFNLMVKNNASEDLQKLNRRVDLKVDCSVQLPR
jgi:outer membrane protein OmpA-like peptidoglycan-associated protein